MSCMSQNYHLRKYYLKTDQAPTQSMMKVNMHPPLAAIYFKSMSPKLKVIAGLEPSLKGGGNIWYCPPKDILQGRTVLKPLKKKYMAKLNCYSVDEVGMELVQVYRAGMEAEKEKFEDDLNEHWQRVVSECIEHSSSSLAEANTEHLWGIFQQFCIIYKRSITKFQDLFCNAATKSIHAIKEKAYQTMQQSYERKLRLQTVALHETYNKKLMKTKAKYKQLLAHRITTHQSRLAVKLHDINLEKHIAIEKLRNFLECQKLACQVYVAMKEKENLAKEMELYEQKNIKNNEKISKFFALTEGSIRYAKEKETKRQELNKTWVKKISHVTKAIQRLVSYCVNTVPDHAEFFINIEKLILLQLNEVLDNPSVESIFTQKVDLEQNLEPKPQPFYMFCDRGHNTEVNKNLCPKHVSSSASQMPAIVINKHCIYAACDNFEQFSDKVKDYVRYKLKDDSSIEDDHDYTRDLNVTYTSSQQLRELKQQSSLMQILQKEIGNIKNVPIDCEFCKIPHCFCSDVSNSIPSLVSTKSSMESDKPKSVKTKIKKEDQEEPVVESYLKYVKPEKCNCSKIAKKNLAENMPVYMRNVSAYEVPKLPNYEMCTDTELKSLVKKARNDKDPPPPQIVEPKARDMKTQTSDHEFNFLCTCLSAERIKDCFGNASYDNSKVPCSIDHFKIVGGSSSSFMQKDSKTFTDEGSNPLKLFKSELKTIFLTKD